VQSWLVGVGWVVYGGQLIGRWFHDAWLRNWAANRRGRSRGRAFRTAFASLLK
jgi:ABC-type uncharacterized transport system permease subunit